MEEEEEEEKEEGKREVFLSTVEDCKNTLPEIKSSSGTELPISQHHTPKSIVQPVTKSDASYVSSDLRTSFPEGSYNEIKPQALRRDCTSSYPQREFHRDRSFSSSVLI